MKKIDPSLYSAGIGAAAGAYTLSSDNDPLAVAAGGVIGGAVGMAGSFTVPSYENMRRNSQGLSLAPQAASTTALQQAREDILSRANVIINSATSSYTGSFDMSAPFTTLSSNNLTQLSDLVYKTTDMIELRRISNALSQRTDVVGLNTKDIKLGVSQTSRSTKIQNGASESNREAAFKNHLRSQLGFVDEAEIQEKFLKFKTLLNKEGTHYIDNGSLTINGMEPIKLYGKIGSGDNAISGHISNGNVYLANDINPMGISQINKAQPKAIAEALGLKVADAFKLQELNSTTNGMTPDDLIAMASNSENITPEALNDIIKKVNQSAPKYDPNLTSQLINLGEASKLTPNAFHRNLQGRTDFSLAFNLENSASGLTLDLDKPLREMKATSSNGNISELTQLARKLARDSEFNVKEGVKPDFATQFVNSRFERKVSNLETPAARNSAAALRESIARPIKDNKLHRDVTQIISDLNLDMHHGDTIAIPRYSVPMDKYNPIVSDILGADSALADGFSISNKRITKGFEMTEARKVVLDATKDGNFSLLMNSTLSKLLSKELDIEDVKTSIEAYSNISENQIKNVLRNPEILDSDSAGISSLKRQVIAEINTGVPNIPKLTESIEGQVKLARQYEADLTYRPGETVGYGGDGLPVKVSKDFDTFRVSNITLTQGTDSKPNLVLAMQGTSNLGDQSISKLFGPDAKTQIRNVGSEFFVKSGLLAEMVNQGDIELLSDGSYSVNGNLKSREELQDIFRKPVKTILADGIFSDISDHYSSLASSFRDEIGIITDSSDSGRKTYFDIKKDIETGSNTNNMDNRIFNFLTSQYETDNRSLKSLSNLGIALTSSKSSSSIVLNSLVDFKDSVETQLGSLKVSQYTHSQDSLDLLGDKLDLIGVDSTAVRQSTPANRAQAFEASYNAVQENYSTFSERVMQYFNDPKLKLTTLNTNPQEYLKFLPIFGSSSSEYTSLAITTPSRNLTGVLGSETVGKAMSQNAQLQLLYSGLTLEDLSLFGGKDHRQIVDLHSLISMKEVQEASINAEADKVPTGAISRAIQSDPELRRSALKEIGINIDGQYGTYNLSSGINGVKSIPIPLESSSIFGSYYSSEADVYNNPRGIQVIADIITNDRKMQIAGTESEREVHKKLLRESVEEFEGIVKSHLFSQDNALVKSASRLHSDTSLLSNVTATSGTIDKFIEARGLEKTHQSFAEVSIQGAMHRLKTAGFNVNNEEDLLENFTEVVTAGGVKVRRLIQSANNPFYSLMNREPSTGPGSIRMLEYIVNPDVDSNDRSLRISWSDKIYKYLQFGDHDADHVVEYFPDYSNTNTQKLYQKMIPITERFSELQEYGSHLGVKGGAKSLTSIMDFLADGDYEKAITNFYSSFQVSNEQAGLRKQVAPAATRLAADLSNTLDYLDIDEASRGNARLLSHYAVENLIKSAHADSSKFSAGKTEVEELEGLRKQYVHGADPQGKYITSLKSFLDNMIHDDATPEAKGIHTEAVKNLVRAETLHATKEPINSMGLNVDKHKPLVEALQNIQDVVSGNNSSKTTFTTSDIETPVEDRMKRGYNEISKTIKQNIVENKKVLAYGGGALLATALLTQKDPTANSARAEANPSAMMLRPLQDTVQSSTGMSRGLAEGLNLNTGTDYVTPNSGKKSYQVDGKYKGSDYRYSMKTSIFGENGIDSARIESY